MYVQNRSGQQLLFVPFHAVKNQSYSIYLEQS